VCHGWCSEGYLLCKEVPWSHFARFSEGRECPCSRSIFSTRTAITKRTCAAICFGFPRVCAVPETVAVLGSPLLVCRHDLLSEFTKGLEYVRPLVFVVNTWR
jgi:hypothetical protein